MVKTLLINKITTVLNIILIIAFYIICGFFYYYCNLYLIIIEMDNFLKLLKWALVYNYSISLE